jgi:hypothetical protein
MSTAYDAIRKQAEAIQNNNNAAKVAELLRQAADLLAAGTKQTAGFTKAEREQMRKDKDARLEKFNSAFGRMQINKQDELLNKHGLKLLNTFENARVYGFYSEGKDTLFRLKTENGKFSVWKAGGAVRQDPTDIAQLEIYLRSDFKKHVK